jgi:hypothetical protein
MAAGISSTDIAFEGLRLVRERPKAVLFWAGLLLAFGVVMAVIMITMAGEAMTRMTELQASSDPDPQAVMAVMGEVAPAYAVLLVPMVLVYGVLYAAINRTVLRPSEGGPGFLRFGGDEIRQIGVLVLFYLLVGGVYMLGAVLLTLIGALLGAALGAAAAGLIAIVGILAAAGFALYVGVRLSLCSPMTFVEGRVRLLASWSLTRERFWPLFGGYLLAVALMVVISLLALTVLGAVAAAVGGGLEGLGRIFRPDFSSLGAYFSPVGVVTALFNAGIGALVLALSVGAAAEAYRQIAGTSPGRGGADL